MQKHQLYINLLALSSALALAACADKGGVEDVVTPPAPEPEPEIVAKTPIVLSVGGEESNTLTRAIITDGTDALEPFDVDTKIFMIMKSVYDTSHPDYQVTGDARNPKYTVSRGDVKKKDDTNNVDGKTVTFDEKNQKYWDDAHARSTKLNIWAYAQKGQSWTTCSFAVDKTGGGYEKHEYQTTDHQPWQTEAVYPMIFNWKASHHDGGAQSETSVMCQDLLFSNNLVDNASSIENGGTGLSGSDKSLKFNFTNRTFPTENVMRFYHAMAKITININEGDGFIKTGDNASSDFKFTSTNIKLTNFNTEGLFSIQQGIFQQINNHSDIPSIYHKTNTATQHVLEALVVPNIDEFMQTYDTPQHDIYSRFVKDDATTVMMEFAIDNNKYQITSGMLYNVLTGKTGATEKTNNGIYIPLEAGKNYVFTFTIGKTAINNITATVASWQNVEANELTPSNTYVSLSLKTDEGTEVNTADPQVVLYRAVDPNEYNGTNYNDWAKYDWNTGYKDNKATLTQSTAGGTVYTAKDESTQWVWPDNTTYYHFRTINKGLSVKTPEGSDPKDYVSISSGAIEASNDYLWGAPFNPTKNNADYTIEYSTTSGFCNAEINADGQIYKAIGATKDNITLIQHHMMSNIYVDLETTTANQVNLTGATVKILRYAKSAQLLMGNGLVTGLSNYDDGTGTVMTSDHHDKVTGDNPVPEYDYSYRVVPQPLSYPEDNATMTIGLEIIADGNVYKIPDLSQHKVSGSETVIDRWLPGKNYYYKFVLKKTGIDNITATVVEWKDVVATPDDEVVIE